jgi:hypothetical protein
MGPSAEISYLNAVLLWKKTQDVGTSLAFLNDALNVELKMVKSIALGYSLLIKTGLLHNR